MESPSLTQGITAAQSRIQFIRAFSGIIRPGNLVDVLDEQIAAYHLARGSRNVNAADVCVQGGIVRFGRPQSHLPFRSVVSMLEKKLRRSERNRLQQRFGRGNLYRAVGIHLEFAPVQRRVVSPYHFQNSQRARNFQFLARPKLDLGGLEGGVWIVIHHIPDGGDERANGFFRGAATGGEPEDISGNRKKSDVQDR